jgi:hypothetical protein
MLPLLQEALQLGVADRGCLARASLRGGDRPSAEGLHDDQPDVMDADHCHLLVAERAGDLVPGIEQALVVELAEVV